MVKKLILVIGLVGIALLGATWYVREVSDHPTTFRTVPVERGDLMATISSTAVIQAEQVVDIGAQVAGMIKSFGADPRDPNKTIDYDSEVEVGTVLAKIDDAIYQTQVHQAKATLENANAVLLQAKTKLDLSKRNWDRAQSLRQRNVMSQADFDAAYADFETSKPALAASDATVAQAKANLEQAEINLAYATIKSPVKGVIVDRRVNVGQTVVSSLNAPSLFLIAKDLKRMQLWASVNEADIGQIHIGQTARFTVDAYPRMTFQGTVSQIRLNATITQNVVTYTVVATTDNSSGRLLPYMTANVKFEVVRRENVLMVPNSALRWRPQPNQMVADARKNPPDGSGRQEAETTADGEQSAPKAKIPSTKARHDEALKAKNGKGDVAKAEGEHSSKSGHRSRREKPTVWIDDDGFARPIPLQTGLTDGTNVQVSGGDLKEGTQVIIGEVRAERGASTKNPFLPTMFRGASRPREQ